MKKSEIAAARWINAMKNNICEAGETVTILFMTRTWLSKTKANTIYIKSITSSNSFSSGNREKNCSRPMRSSSNQIKDKFCDNRGFWYCKKIKIRFLSGSLDKHVAKIKK